MGIDPAASYLDLADRSEFVKLCLPGEDRDDTLYRLVLNALDVTETDVRS